MLYDWYGLHLEEFKYIKDISKLRERPLNYSLDIVRPSAPNQYATKKNFVYSLKKQKRK